jgi:hypothetical protein
VLRCAADDELLGPATIRKNAMPSNAAMMLVAHRFCGWRLYCAKLRMAPPRPPAIEDGWSPMIAPTMLAVADTRKAVKRYGSAAGNRSFQSTVPRDAQLRQTPSDWFQHSG